MNIRLIPLLVAAPLLATAPARAQTSAQDCLAASDASIRSDNEHRLRAEKQQLLACASAGCPADIRSECVRRLDEVSAAIPTVVFEAKDQEGSDLSAVTVTMDGEVIATRLDGIPIPVDPGIHLFVFDAAGQAPVRKNFVIRQGQRNRNEPIAFRSITALATARPPRAPAASTPALAMSASASPVEREAIVGPQRTLAIVAAAAGLAAVGVGSVYGVKAMRARDSALRVCPNVCARQTDADMWQDAKRSGNVSTAAFVAGGVGLAGALVLWLTGKPEPARASEVAWTWTASQSGELSLAVTGRW